MNKITLFNDEGTLAGTLQKTERQAEVLNAYEAEKIFSRIPKNSKTYLRHHPNKKDPEVTMFINKKSYLVKLEGSYHEIIGLVNKVRKEKRVRNKNIKTIGGVTATIASLGVGAAVLIAATANHPYDPEVDSQITYEEEQENTKAIPIITEEQLIDNNIELADGTIVKVDDAHTYNVELDNNSVYDPGIEERILPYKDIIEERSNRWGISPDLLYDIASQEYGGETDKRNIWHVEFDTWQDYRVKAFNFETNRYEYIVLTTSPENYIKIDAERSNISDPKAVDQTITPEELKDPQTSCSYASIIMQNLLTYYKGNFPLAIFAYNNGMGTTDKVINLTAEAYGYTYDEIVAQKEGTMWFKYRDIGQSTDPNYLYNVVKHVSNDNENNNEYYAKLPNADGTFEIYYFKMNNEGMITEKDTSEQAKGR